ncbi:hypothetical protein GJ496_001156 [Pomphorhynchus laevis]|nr:hypothetical protein GJ496_001156 [Pomphorhynchus laevis]
MCCKITSSDLIAVYITYMNKLLYKHSSDTTSGGQTAIAATIPSSSSAANALQYSHPLLYEDIELFKCECRTCPINDQFNSLNTEDLILLAHADDHTDNEECFISVTFDDLKFLSASAYVLPIGNDLSVSSDNLCIDVKENIRLTMVLNNHNVTTWIIDTYRHFLKSLITALNYEERRTNYLRHQISDLQKLYDDSAASLCSVSVESKRGNQILSDSVPNISGIEASTDLSNLLRTIFEQIANNAEVFVKLNNWINISHVFPHRFIYRYTLTAEIILNAEHYIKPYHSLLLTVERDKFLKTLPSSSLVYEFVRKVDSRFSLLKTAISLRISSAQSIKLAARLIYNRKAKLIFPISGHNVYVLSDFKNIDDSCYEDFGTKFNYSLNSALMDFTLDLNMHEKESELIYDHRSKVKYLQTIEWMLHRNLISHIHTYIFVIQSVNSGFDIPKNSFELQLAVTNQLTSSVSEIDNAGSNDGRCTLQHEFTHLNECNKSQAKGFIYVDDNIVVNSYINRELMNKSDEDKALFKRLYKYFKRVEHIEAIMFMENVSRGEVLSLVYSLPNLLYTAQIADDNPLLCI